MVPNIWFFGSLHFNTTIFLADNVCNCLNSSCASLGENKIEIDRIVFELISIFGVRKQ